MPELSVITAFFNEAETLPLFRQRLCAVLEGLGRGAEILLVDDHSNDHSPALAREWAKSDARVVYIRLSRNCGSHAAFAAGLANCRGECAVLLAADLQDPPETIPALLDKRREGHDVVWAVREHREGASWSARFSAALYYRLMRRLGLSEMPATGADFLLVDRKVIDACNAIREKNTSILAMILWMGFRQTSISYVKKARSAGGSKWTFAKKLKLFADSVVSFSYAPIRFTSWFGLALALCGFLYAAIVVIGWFVGFIVAGVGFAALMTVLLIGQGAILVSLGVIGEYVWRAFDEARGRPRYIVEDYRSSDFLPRGDSLPVSATCSTLNGATPEAGLRSHAENVPLADPQASP
jgi:glycosyltransferase involved in cell wall biosynthesis